MRNWIQSFLLHHQISKDLLVLLMIGALYALGIFMSNTFVNVYLWRQTSDYMTIASYNLAITVFHLLSFILAGKLAKVIDRILILRVGVIFLSVFFMAVLYVGPDAGKYYQILGSLLGIGYGFYWLAFNLLAFEITEPETRDVFNGLTGGLESLGGMTGPLLAGLLIAKLPTNIGYMTVFSISLGLFLIAVFCSFLIQKRKAFGKYQLPLVVREIKRNLNWRHIVFANFFQGMREGLFVFVVTIWIFLVTSSELSLGIFNLLLNGFSLVLYLLVTKWVTPAFRKKAILISAIVISFSVGIILSSVSFIGFLVYATVLGIFFPIMHVPLSSMGYDVIGTSYQAKELRIEYVVMLEIFVQIGRMTSILAFLAVVYVYQESAPIHLLLLIFSPTYLCIYFLIRRIKLPTEY